MRKLLGTLMLGVIVLGVLGFFRGWFSVSTNTESDRTKIEVTIDRERVLQDTGRLKSSVKNLSERVQGDSPASIDAPGDSSFSPADNPSLRPVLPPDF